MPGGIKLAVEAAQGEISLDSLYSRISGDRSLWYGLIERFADESIYRIKNPRLPNALHEHLCSHIPEEPRSEIIRASQKCADMDVARRLRQLAEGHDVPFHYVGIKVIIGKPSPEDKPGLGTAHACRNSEFRGRQIELTNSQTGVSITVRVSGLYICTGYSLYPDIQIGRPDARMLCGYPTDKLEDAVAVVVN